MSDSASGPSEMEKILGRTFSRTRTVPGLTPKPGRQFCYLEFNGPAESFGEFFNQVTNLHQPSFVKKGGAMSENCRLVTADGRSFFGISYKGDLAGWEQQIAAGADAKSITTARIVDGILVNTDGSQWPLEQVEATYY
ncbi:MAG: hypothetical protein ACRBC3_08060 [Burkholderiaceae bacterium]